MQKLDYSFFITQQQQKLYSFKRRIYIFYREEQVKCYFTERFIIQYNFCIRWLMKKLKQKKSFTFLYNKFENNVSRKCLLLVYVSVYVYFSKKDKVHFDFCTYKSHFLFFSKVNRAQKWWDNVFAVPSVQPFYL